MTLKHKAFLTALRLLDSNSLKAKSFLSDKRMTHQEKIILSSFIALRDYENHDIIQVLSPLICQDPFVESQRLYCLGAAHNNLTHFAEAEKYLLESIEMNVFEGGENNRVASFQSLFTVYLNTHNFQKMEETIARLKKKKPVTEKIAVVIQYCEFSLAVQKQEISLAKSLIPKMEKTYPVFNEHQSISYLYDLFDLHLFENNYTACSEALERIKRLKKYKTSAHVKYMQTMVGFIQNNSPIYLYEKDFHKYPLLLNQMLCLQALERGDSEKALDAWFELRKILPEHIGEPFEYSGPPTLFSKALDKFKMEVKPVVSVAVQEKMTKEEKLISVLAQSSLPLSKEVIYQELWSKEVDSKDDLKKLVKVVQRAREKYSVDIQSVKGSYVIRGKKSA